MKPSFYAVRFLSVCVVLAAAVCANVPPPAPPSLPALPSGAVVTISEAEARVELARVLLYSGQPAAAVAEYDRALVLQPGDPAVRAERAQALVQAGRRDEAVADLAALPVEELPLAAAVLLADLLLGEKRFAEAVGLYRVALARVPGDLLIRFKLARVLAWDRRFDESLAEFERLLAAAPDDVQIRRHYAQVLGWAGRFEEAAAQWRRTLPEEL